MSYSNLSRYTDVQPASVADDIDDAGAVLMDAAASHAIVE